MSNLLIINVDNSYGAYPGIIPGINEKIMKYQCIER